MTEDLKKCSNCGKRRKINIRANSLLKCEPCLFICNEKALHNKNYTDKEAIKILRKHRLLTRNK